MRLAALARKESLLLLRDWHALLLLFAMPAVFILVMSLVLQNAYASHGDASFRYYLVDQDASPASAALVKALAGAKEFRPIVSPPSIPTLETDLRRERAEFLLVIPRGFAAALGSAHALPVTVEAGPSVEPSVDRLFAAVLRSALARVYLQAQMSALAAHLPGSPPALDFSAVDRLVTTQSLYEVGGTRRVPTSVQQNVPAWLLFAMFFIAVPLSTTWVQERQQGTYARLRSMGVSAPAMLGGKLVPYVVVNLLQVVLMLAVGVFLVPRLGGDRLDLGGDAPALMLITGSASIAAVGYALLIANLVASTEQATVFTGAANLLMAALGGIMVPRFLMPRLMQLISDYSPMSWGLDGFLDVFLRRGGVASVAPEAFKLMLFGLACFAAATLAMRRVKWR